PHPARARSASAEAGSGRPDPASARARGSGTVTYARRPLAYAWFLALVLGVGPAVTHAITALGPIIVENLGLSATRFGLLWFVTFGAAASLSVFAGRAADRVSARPLVTGVFLCA